VGVVVKASLIVFVKAPRPGRVKTRLAAAIGDSAAAEIYRALAERVVEQTRGPYARLLFADGVEEVQAWLPGELCISQQGEDLGARMASAFAWAFTRGHSRVVLIGTDAPDVDRADVQSAIEALEACDVVLGPAADGGYYLIALARPCPGLFDGVAWSTPTVLAATLGRAQTLGLRVTLLEPRADIDTADDLRRAWPQVSQWLSPALFERLTAALEADSTQRTTP
jgi:uncharacterized protein